MTRTRNSERGSAMLLTLIVIASLMAGAAVLVSMQLVANKSTELSRTGMTSLHCAEAGLAMARATVKSNYSSWGAALAASGGATPDTSEPSWLTTGIGSHDLDGDGVGDFTVYLKDNDDEIPPATNDLTVDKDLRVFVVSRCTKYADTPKQVQELIQYNGAFSCGYNEDGGCDGNGSFAQ